MDMNRIYNKIVDFVFVRHYREFMVFTLGLFILFTLPLILSYFQHGYFIKKDISLEGGYMFKFPYNEQIVSKIKSECSTCKIREVSSLAGNAYVEILLPKDTPETLILKIKKILDDRGIKYMFSEMSPIIGKNVLKTLIYTLIFSFFLVFISVYLFLEAFYQLCQ